MKTIGTQNPMLSLTCHHCIASTRMRRQSWRGDRWRSDWGPETPSVRLGEPRRAGSRRAPRGPTSSWRSSGSRVPIEPLELEARALERRARRGVSACRSHHAKTSTADRGRGERDRAAGQRARPLDRAAQQQRAREVGGQHRRDQVRAAALVLLRRVARRRRRRPRRRAIALCSTPWYGGELAAAQREQRRREARSAPRPTSPPTPRSAGAAAARRPTDAPAATPSTDGSWNGSRASGSAALDQRDDRERLGQPHDAAHAGDLVGGAQPRLAARRDLHRAVVRAHGGRPVRRAVHEQPVAQGHPAQTELAFCYWHPTHPLMREASSVAPAKKGCGDAEVAHIDALVGARASAARSRRASGGAAGRSRRRRSRGTRRGTSGESVNAGSTTGTASAPGSLLADPVRDGVHQRRLRSGERLPTTASVNSSSSPSLARAPRGRAPIGHVARPCPGGTRQSTRDLAPAPG